MDEPGRDRRAGHVADQVPAPLDRHVLEDDQVNGQGAQVRAHRDRRVRHARRAGRQVLPAAPAQSQVQVMLNALRGPLWRLQLLVSPDCPQVLRAAPGPHRTRTSPAGSNQGSHQARPSTSPIPTLAANDRTGTG